ncbi:potassium channel family protein [Crocosphaera sp.]|uniref:potassium channel family protein n=1 Tax=Crocosphaera sp. TaxID=2729996 RepID=UPI00260F532D|nr:potassium channel family protein [Crocosphaera sp.]MDJ0580721.1 potassium channel family protein [Crocosphaera sp.]
MTTIKQSPKIYSLTTGYSRLFIDLVIVFFLVPFASFNRNLNLLVSLVFLITLLLGLNTLALPKRTILSLRFLAAFGFTADVIVFPNADYLTEVSSFISHSLYSIFILIVIIAISSRIYNEEKVNLDVIRGGICIYLLLGILWFFFYQIIMFFDPNALSIPKEASHSSLFYFSFTTLTTLGYGDITPNNAFAMILTNAEALVGQIYPAVVIAKLVSLYKVESK